LSIGIIAVKRHFAGILLCIFENTGKDDFLGNTRCGKIQPEFGKTIEFANNLVYNKDT